MKNGSHFCWAMPRCVQKFNRCSGLLLMQSDHFWEWVDLKQLSFQPKNFSQRCIRLFCTPLRAHYLKCRFLKSLVVHSSPTYILERTIPQNQPDKLYSTCPMEYVLTFEHEGCCLVRQRASDPIEKKCCCNNVFPVAIMSLHIGVSESGDFCFL